MSPLPPEHLTASPWSPCVTCGTMLVSQRKCPRCHNTPQRSDLRTWGGGPAVSVPSPPALVTSGAGAADSVSTFSLPTGNINSSINDQWLVWALCDPSEQSLAITLDGAGPLAASGTIGSDASYLLFLFILRQTTPGPGVGDLVANGSFPQTLGLGYLLARHLATTPLDRSTAAAGSSTAPDSGLTSATTQASEFLAGCIVSEGPPADAAGTWSNGFTAAARDGSPSATLSLGYRVVSVTAQYRAQKSGLTSRAWIAYLATLKAQL